MIHKGSVAKTKNRYTKNWKEVLFVVVVLASRILDSSLWNTYPTSNSSSGFAVTAMVIRSGSPSPTGKNHQEFHPQRPTKPKPRVDSRFPFLDPSIANILQCETKKETKQVDQEGESSTPPNPRIFVQVDKSNHKLTLQINSAGGKDDAGTILDASLEDLVDLARGCDDFVFGGAVVDERFWSLTIQGLIHLAGVGTNRGSNSIDDVMPEVQQQRQPSPRQDDAKITVATLLALNGLESAIRHSLGHVTGRAPLLQSMIAQMAAANTSPTTTTLSTPATVLSQRQLMAAILQQLLLPHPVGINLRNILWHGFVGGALPRSWLAMVLVLITILQQDDDAPTNSSNVYGSHATGVTSQCMDVFSFRFSQNPSLRYLVSRSDVIADRISQFRRADPHDENHLYHSSFQQIKTWLPPSHHGLWDLALDWIHDGTRPACTIAILTILLEHALRLDWCRLNQRPEDSWARPGTFFVTLDGHGQRNVHDLLLHPNVSIPTTNTTTANTPTASTVATPKQLTCSLSERDETPDSTKHPHQPPSTQEPQQQQERQQQQRPNQLIYYLGGSTIALLTDLFASSSGGPNIRATISHGMWDAILDQELTGLLSHHSISPPASTGATDTSMVHGDQSNSSAPFWDMARVILVAMEDASKQQGNENDNSMVGCLYYRPVYSFTATTQQYLHQARESLLQLLTLQATSSHLHFAQHAQREFAENSGRNDSLSNLLMMPPAFLPSVPNTKLKRLLCMLGGQDSDDEDEDDAPAMSEWSAENVFAEHETNQQLASCSGAARSLLQDVASATLTHLNVLTTALSELDHGNSAQDEDCVENRKTSSRQRRRRQLLRVVHASELAFDMYSFAAMVSVISIEQELRPLDKNDGIPRKVLLKAVERSRMVVSTVGTFLYDNPDRAIKAVREYVKGKVIKEVAAKASQSS